MVIVTAGQGVILQNYPTVSTTVMMKTEPYKHYIEIMPAALLSQRRTWHKAAQTLPVGACLLVTNPRKREQIKLMKSLSRIFQEKGKKVFFWAVK